MELVDLSEILTAVTKFHDKISKVVPRLKGVEQTTHQV